MLTLRGGGGGFKDTLRKCDFDEFMAHLYTLHETWCASAESLGGPAARAEKAKEHKEKAKELIKDHPELLKGFDNFVDNSRMVSRTYPPPNATK